nr:hypothetical protein [Fodinicola feengrottensis]
MTSSRASRPDRSARGPVPLARRASPPPRRTRGGEPGRTDQADRGGDQDPRRTTENRDRGDHDQWAPDEQQLLGGCVE